MQPRPFYLRIYKSRAGRVAVEIAADVLVTSVLLLGLTAIHAVLSHTEASDGFKEMFSRFHEWTVLLTYSIIAIKSLIRLIKH